VGAAVDAARRDDDSVAGVQALCAALQLGGATRLDDGGGSGGGGGSWLWELEPQPDETSEANAAAEAETALTLIARALTVCVCPRSVSFCYLTSDHTPVLYSPTVRETKEPNRHYGA
jgi:hypothetical protein